jgi:hypothetical protein
MPRDLTNLQTEATRTREDPRLLQAVAREVIAAAQALIAQSQQTCEQSRALRRLHDAPPEEP